MFDLGISELLVIGIVALIVIGPKDLPELFRSLGRFTAKMRAMAREFSRAMEAAADESGMKDVAKDLKTATSAKSMGLDAVKDAAAKFEKWDPMKNAARPSAPSVAAKPAPVPSATSPVASTPVPATPAAAMGPSTQALAEQQAARKAVAAEAAEKLKSTRLAATPDPAAAPPAKAAPAKAAPKPRAKAAPKSPDAVAKPPRAPRKTTPRNPKADA
jgi:sec-independent protein translocase protein TatB